MKNYFDIQGKVAYVTGASSGLGVQFAKCLAEQGARVAITARRVEKLEAVQQEIEADGGECFATSCDVTDPASVEKAVAEIKDHYGRIDILVNTAGVANGTPIHLQSYEDWDRIVKTNLYGTYNCIHEVGKIMVEQQYGKIINMGSIHSKVGMPGLPLNGYAATKGGVLMLTKEVANEYAKSGITVNAIGPAYFGSEMTQKLLDNEDFMKVIQTYCPMGRPGKPGELNGILLYLASDASSYTTGAYIPVDGGWTAI
ncbi:MAG: SDR family NAD(P)-dependent oxidoreductase [Eggerthellaceae bacterium]|jgi:NAD(P)-dependent dehydrogenase (short-subunit alcohol dehydrogenase family)